MLRCQSEDFAVLADDQLLCGSRKHHVDVACLHVVVDDFEEPGAAAESFGPGKFGISREVLQFD